MAFVLDASVALAWYFPDEATGRTNELRERLAREDIIVPAHWSLEVTNALLAAHRRGRLDERELHDVANDLQRLPGEVDGRTDEAAWGATLELARKHHLTSYDAAYMELALRRAIPLATLDKTLAAAASANGAVVLVADV